jgi:hypothetical protein
MVDRHVEKKVNYLFFGFRLWLSSSARNCSFDPLGCPGRKLCRRPIQSGRPPAVGPAWPAESWTCQTNLRLGAKWQPKANEHEEAQDPEGSIRFGRYCLTCVKSCYREPTENPNCASKRAESQVNRKRLEKDRKTCSQSFPTAASQKPSGTRASMRSSAV